MRTIDVSLNLPQSNLFALAVMGGMDLTDGVSKIEVMGVCRGKVGETVQQLDFTVEELPSAEGLSWVKTFKVSIEGHNPVFFSLDTQRWVLSTDAHPEHADFVLTIGLETENANRMPLQ